MEKLDDGSATRIGRRSRRSPTRLSDFRVRGTIASTARPISVAVERTGEQVFVTYELAWTTGRTSRNTEILTLRNGKIIDVEVYFGWSIPHEAPEGGFVVRA